jgi:spore coat polysaccharide biosynthesis protein SpsF (cytidylyltransferase family)
MRAGAIIQARLGATRLPRKVMLEVLGKSILEYVIERVRASEAINNVIVATSTAKENLAIVNIAEKLGVKAYRGSEQDVLDRFYKAAKEFNLKNIVRITADCPLIDPQVINRVVRHYFKSKADYCSNTLKPTFPDGQDVEVFSFDALDFAWKNALLPSEREHVTPYIYKHPEKFWAVNVKNKIDLSRKRWTLDQKEDFEFIKNVLENLYPIKPDFGMNDVLKFLKNNSSAEEFNRNITRNEGYIKSLKKDKVVKRGSARR